jgi:hypothetical protein
MSAMTLDELIQNLWTQAQAERALADKHIAAALQLFSRIEGIREARELLGDPAGEPPKPTRKPRRDIRSLVAQVEEMFPEYVGNPGLIAAQIGCRVRQVDAVLEKRQANGGEA